MLRAKLRPLTPSRESTAWRATIVAKEKQSSCRGKDLEVRKPKSGPQTSHAVSRRCDLPVPFRLRLVAAWPIIIIIGTVPWCEKGQYWQVVNMFVSAREDARFLWDCFPIIVQFSPRWKSENFTLKQIWNVYSFVWGFDEMVLKLSTLLDFWNECFLNLCSFCKAKLPRP